MQSGLVPGQLQYGDVTSTCHDDVVGNTTTSNYWKVVCNVVTDVGGSGGDSGAPVFKESGATGAIVYGITWGVNVFSPVSQIENEFGSLVCH